MHEGGMIEGWVLAFEFESWEIAGGVYEQARDVIFREDVDASVYRILLNGRPHVVALGLVATKLAVQSELEALLGSFGRDSQLPEEVLLTLILRRAEVSGSDVRFEHRSGH